MECILVRTFLIKSILILFSSFICSAQLSGAYTVGGIDTSGALAYKNLQAVITDLEQQGINGPVTINIKPGTYNVGAALTYIPGTNTVNRIVIQAENLDSSSVVLTHNGSGSTMQLLNAQFVTLQYLTITNEGNNGDYDNHVLSIIDPYEVAVKHCRIGAWNYYGSTTDNHSPVLVKFWSEGIRKKCLVTACTITSDLFGFYITGGNGALTFSNNKIFNNSTYSFVSSSSSELYITGNEMNQSVSCTYNLNKLFLIDNNIHGDIKTDGPGPVFQGNIVDGVADFAHPVVLKDNIFNGTLKLSSDNITLDGNIIESLDFSNGAGFHMYDNTIKDFYCIYASDVHLFRNQFSNSFYLIANEYKQSEIINNTFTGYFEMYAFELTFAYNNVVTDSVIIGWQSVNILNNNFNSDFAFTPYNGSIRDYNNYYPALSTSESHSFHIDPKYISSTDLHIQNIALTGLDTLFYPLANDIDGDIRIGHSAIGADAICFPDTFTAGSDLTISCGDSIILTPFMNSGADFQWIGYPSLDTFYNSTPLISPVQDQTYVLDATDACGHTYHDSVLVNVESFQVEASMQDYPEPSCGLSVQLSATFIPSYSYHWSPAQLVSDSDKYLTTASNNQPMTTYIVEAFHPQCGTTTDSITIELNTSVISDFGVIVYSNLADFINKSTFPGWYVWDFGDGTQSYEMNPDHTYFEAGWYEVTLYTTNSCGEADTISKWINYNSVGIDEINAQLKIVLRVEPNPFQQKAILIAEGFDKQISKAHLQIVSAIGNIEVSQSVDVRNGQFTYDLCRSIFPTGVHLIRIVSNNGTSVATKFECK